MRKCVYVIIISNYCNNIQQTTKAEGSKIRIMKNTIKKLWNGFTTCIVALAVILAVLLVGARIVGLQVFTVLSGSMEPAIHTGSLIYVKSVNTAELEADDVITFMLNEDTVATHRIVEVVPDENDSSVVRFRTKGDANDAADGALVHYKNVIGTPIISIPYLGYVANYIQNPPGMYVAIAVAALILMLTFIPDLFAKEETTKDKREKKTGKAV